MAYEWKTFKASTNQSTGWKSFGGSTYEPLLIDEERRRREEEEEARRLEEERKNNSFSQKAKRGGKAILQFAKDIPKEMGRSLFTPLKNMGEIATINRSPGIAGWIEKKLIPKTIPEIQAEGDEAIAQMNKKLIEKIKGSSGEQRERYVNAFKTINFDESPDLYGGIDVLNKSKRQILGESADAVFTAASLGYGGTIAKSAIKQGLQSAGKEATKQAITQTARKGIITEATLGGGATGGRALSETSDIKEIATQTAIGAVAGPIAAWGFQAGGQVLSKAVGKIWSKLPQKAQENLAQETSRFWTMGKQMDISRTPQRQPTPGFDIQGKAPSVYEETGDSVTDFANAILEIRRFPEKGEQFPILTKWAQTVEPEPVAVKPARTLDVQEPLKIEPTPGELDAALGRNQGRYSEQLKGMLDEKTASYLAKAEERTYWESVVGKDNIDGIKKLLSSKNIQENDITRLPAYDELAENIRRDLGRDDLTSNEVFDIIRDIPTWKEINSIKPPKIGNLSAGGGRRQMDKVLKEITQGLQVKSGSEPTRLAVTATDVATPITVKGTFGGLKPVGEGKLKLSRLAARIQGQLDAIPTEDIPNLPVYREMKNAPTLEKAVEYATRAPEETDRILAGELSAPEGIPVNALMIARDRIAMESGDGKLALELATGSQRSTALGQEIEILKTFAPHSPTKMISKLQQAKIEGYGIEKYAKNQAKELGTIKKAIRQVAPSQDQIRKFVDDLRC